MDNHHVAWKDHLGLNRVWEQDILVCSSSFKTDGYPVAVYRFYNDIINIKDGVKLRDIIDAYIKGELKSWRDAKLGVWANDNRSDARVPEILARTRKEIEISACERLYNFIIQTLEDNGFCFYKSKLEEDEIL